MADTKITIRDHGPFLVEGPFTLVDGEGNEYQLDGSKPAYALCRCGASAINRSAMVLTSRVGLNQTNGLPVSNLQHSTSFPHWHTGSCSS